MNNYTVFACVFAFFWSISLRAMLFSLTPVFAQQFHLSTLESGLFISIYYLGYGLSVQASSFLGGSRKQIAIAGFLLSFLALVATSLAKSFFSLTLFTTLATIGAGFYMPRGISLISQASTPRTLGRNLSFHELGASTGMILGPLFTGLALGHLPWQGLILTWAGLSLLTIAIFSRIREQTIPPNHVKVFFKLDKLLISYTLVGGILFIILVGLISVLPLLMVKAWHLSPAYAASFVGATRITGLLGPLMSGPLSDRWGRFKVMEGFWILIIFSLVIMSWSGFNIVFTIALLLLTWVASGTTPVYYASMTETYPEETRDRAVGISSGMASIIANTGAPIFLSFLIEHFPPGITFATTTLMAAAALWLTHFLGKARIDSWHRG